jgi:ATP-binding cassette subfamily F protein 2
MPSDRVKKAAKAKGPKKSADGGKDSAATSTAQGSSANLQALDAAADGVAKLDLDSGRTVAGVLASHPLARDLKVDQVTLLYHGHELLADSQLELNYGRFVGQHEMLAAAAVGLRA